MNLRRPSLHRIAPPVLGAPTDRIITMSVGQWDELLAEAYRDGWILLELDEYERFVQAYRKEAA